MQAQVKAFMTTGVAIVGAGIIAAPSIMTAPPADISVRADDTRTQAVTLAADVEALQLQEGFEELLAGTELIERVRAAVAYIIEAGLGSGFEGHEQADDPIDGAFRLGEGVGASALRTLYGAALLPLGVVAVAQAVAEGVDPGLALAEFIRQTIDGPAWAANPILFALRDTLMEPLGGADGFFADAQWDLAQASTRLGNTIVSLLGLGESTASARLASSVEGAGLLGDVNPVARIQQAISTIFEDGFGEGFDEPDQADGPIEGAFRLAEGFGASLIRTLYGTALVPLGLLSVPAALASGDDPAEALADFVTATVHGPSWAANPILFALRDTLIEPLGGADGVFADVQNQFQLASKEVGNTLVSLLGLHPVSTMAVSADASGALGDPFGRAQEAFEYIVDKGFGAGFEPYEAAEGVVDGLFRLGEGFGAAAVRTASGAAMLPLGLVGVAGAVVDEEQDPEVALARFITDTVHGPSWAVNPVLFALRDVLIEPLGGKTGVFAEVQDRLQLGSKEASAAIVSALGLEVPEARDTPDRQVNARVAQAPSGAAGTMRLAPSSPTAVPGQGAALEIQSGSEKESLKRDDDTDKSPLKLRTERKQQREEARAEQQQKREDARAERQQKRQSKVKKSQADSSNDAE